VLTQWVVWWRWGESNPRPNRSHTSFYVCSRSLMDSPPQLPSDRATLVARILLKSRTASRIPGFGPSPLPSPLSPSGRQSRDVAELCSHCVTFVSIYCFGLLFTRPGDQPRHATDASTCPSKPVIPFLRRQTYPTPKPLKGQPSQRKNFQWLDEKFQPLGKRVQPRCTG